MSTERGIVHLVGAGPGDPELLTVKALRLLRRADSVVHDRLVGKAILALIPSGTARINVGKRCGGEGITQDEINDLLIRLALQGKRVVRLKGGDPLVFGRGGEELEALAAAGIRCTIVPGITAALGCAAAMAIPLTHRCFAQALTLMSAHRRDGAVELDWPLALRPGQTVAIYMGGVALPVLQRELIARGMSPDTAAAAVIAGTTPRQRVISGTIGNLALDEREADEPVMILIGPAVALADLIPPVLESYRSV
jgi:uroporphyrin-III C-methyltransferase